MVEARALVGELADERTTSSALQNFAVDLQFNGQVNRSPPKKPCLTVHVRFAVIRSTAVTGLDSEVVFGYFWADNLENGS